MNQATAISKRYVMITLVSQQPLPNIIPIFQKGAPHFDEIIFLYTGRFKEIYKQVETVLKGRFPTLETTLYSEKVDNGVSEVTQQVACRIIRELRASAAKGGYEVEIVCNWTLGTKPMSVGLVEAARDRNWERNYPTIYVDSENERIIDPSNIYPGSQRDKAFDLNLTVKEYLQAYGMSIISYSTPRPEWINASYVILEGLAASNLQDNQPNSLETYKGFFEGVRSNLGRLKGDSTNPDKYRTLKVKSKALEVAELAEQLRRHDLVRTVSQVQNNQVEIELTSLDVLDFLNGLWLEIYIYGKLYEKFGQTKGVGVENQVAQNVKFT